MTDGSVMLLSLAFCGHTQSAVQLSTYVR